ncbi:C-type lectin domain family 4 member E-like isoform X3 [Limanda limanda]|uniref:C-type lectin domain family 4 member E-like isoform X2 n=1 Tax=Limanda limanda TaxID=27771 RepID=UPI0029C7BB15|nr:C-type lectin domain family 4 member E-like isoform X2 [Limanda limanda]XP_060948346.1 C-type lectin domain family 4 member E-like isoform X3 [Limanda limanda]
MATPSMDEPDYSNVNYSETQRPASSRRSGVTWERVALLVLSVLLAAALTALGVTLHENTQTKKRLQKYQDEAKILTEILSGTEPSKVEQPTKPPSVRDETCPRCEDGWEPHGGKCYFFSWVTSSWNKSRKQCTSMSGDLVVINNREEQRFLVSRVRGKMEKDEEKFWIGLTDAQKEDEWLWVDDTRLDPNLTFWREGEPDNWAWDNPDGQDCVRMGEKDGATNLKTWEDKYCKWPHKYICEKPEKA